MKLKKIVNGYESFIHLMNGNELLFQLKWDISDIVEMLEKHYKRYQEERNLLLKKHGEQDKKNPSNFLFKNDGSKLFNESIETLGNSEIKIEFKKIKKELLFDIKINGKVNISALKTFLD